MMFLFDNSNLTKYENTRTNVPSQACEHGRLAVVTVYQRGLKLCNDMVEALMWFMRADVERQVERAKARLNEKPRKGKEKCG